MAGKVSLILTAKNLLSGKLKKARASIRKFATRAKAAFVGMAKGALIATGAIIAVGTKLVKAYAEQEAAERALIAARRASGDVMADNITEQKKIAAQMQDETGIADELTLKRMARLRLLGVETDALGDAAKATIALVHAGMGEETALRAVAAARAGDFNMLTRYIPALRTAKTEAEKAEIVNNLLNSSYEASQEELDTVAGRWRELKGRVGDFMETLGGVIAQDAGVKTMLGNMANRIKDATTSLTEWIAGGGLTNLVNGVKTFGAQASFEFMRIKTISGTAFKVMWQTARTAFENVGTAAFNAATVTKNAWKGTTDNVGHWLAKMWAKVRGEEWNITPPKPPFEDITKGTVELKDVFAETEQTWLDALAKIADKNKATADDVAAIWEKTEERKQEAARKTTAATTKEAKKQAKIELGIAQVKQRADIAGFKKLVEGRKQIIEAGVAGLLKQREEKREKEKAAKDERERAEKLREKLGRGTKLSKRDVEFLKAFNTIEKLKEQQPKLEKKAEDAAKALAEKNLKKLGGIKDVMDKIEKQNKALLAAR
jgi:hypothetical protein